MIVYRWIFAALVLGLSCSSKAEVFWEAGIGIGHVTAPDYPGSDEYQAYTLPIPYLQLKTDRWSIDRQGIHGGLFKLHALRLDLDLELGLPTDSGDNGARRGMPDLGPAVQIGPSLVYRLYQTDSTQWELYLPVRRFVALEDGSLNAHGWVLQPYLFGETHFGRDASWLFSFAIGPQYSDRKYQDYFYGVDEAYVTEQRSFYEAEAGYSGIHSRLGLRRRFSDYWFGIYLRYQQFDNTSFEDSPLLKQRDYLLVGVGFSWIFAGSKQ